MTSDLLVNFDSSAAGATSQPVALGGQEPVRLSPPGGTGQPWLPQHAAVLLASGRRISGVRVKPDHAGVSWPLPRMRVADTGRGVGCGLGQQRLGRSGLGRSGLEQKRGLARDQWRDSRNCLWQAQ